MTKPQSPSAAFFARSSNSTSTFSAEMGTLASSLYMSCTNVLPSCT